MNKKDKRIHIRLTDGEKDALDRLAKKLDRPRSYIMRKAFKEFYREAQRDAKGLNRRKKK